MTDKATIRPEQVRGARIETMEPYQERVIAEKKELDERRERLEHFILFGSAGVLAAELERMKLQLDIMGQYADVLGERIAAFTETHA